MFPGAVKPGRLLIGGDGQEFLESKPTAGTSCERDTQTLEEREREILFLDFYPKRERERTLGGTMRNPDRLITYSSV